ncbi:MAG: extracellular solute-binding protein [Anaerolineae bacterium]|nr:extracellular solute-binding protein [Anaerolineae bacterium]
MISACSTLSSPTPTAVPTADSASGIKSIRFFTTETAPNQISTLLGLIDEYQTLNPDIHIDVVMASPASRGRRLLMALASGADLGIFEIEPTFMSEWANAGYLLPLDDVVNAIGADQYMAGSLFTSGGHVYAIPYASSVYGLWVRTDLLAQVGLPLPTTYDAVLTAAHALTQGNAYGIGLPGGQNVATSNYFSAFLWQNDGDYFDCQGNVVFGTSQALQAVEKWVALTQYAPPGFTTWGYGEQIEAFTRGRVAMVMYGGRLGVQLAADFPDLVDNVTVIPPPWGDVPITLGVWSRFAIAAGTQHQPEARAFLQWLMSGDRLLRYDMTVPGHMIPPLESVRLASLDTPNDYTASHPEWMRFFYQWLPNTAHPAMRMGVIHDGKLTHSTQIPPWADAAFGDSGVIVTMLQDISLRHHAPEEAWREAVTQLEGVVESWRAQHPDWQPTDCQQSP